ncbi:MAG: aminopeptidase P family N-terminal domain-containing protein, partial [Dongiaceae bacterium]
MSFDRTEFEARLAKTRRAMAERGIALMVVTDPSNMAWLTGYDGWSFYVHQCVLVGESGEPWWIGRGMDAAGAKLTTYLDHARIVSYPDNYVQSRERHPYDFIAKFIADQGQARAAIGVEMDNYYFSAACLESLRKHLPQARIEDATGLVNWQRSVKSPAEIEYIRRAARIVERMHTTAMELVEPGMRMND